MKKVGLALFAALLVVALPLSAMAKTDVYNFKDMDVDLWEACKYAPSASQVCWGENYCRWSPVGPAYEFKQNVLIHYVGTEKFNARVKNGDVGWNRNVHGTAYIYGDSGPVVTEAMSTAQKPPVMDAPGSTLTMYEWTTPMNCGPASAPSDISSVEPLYTGPFQIEEVVQDDGGDFGCFTPSQPAPVNFQDCTGPWKPNPSPILAVDYLMLHVKITGNKIYFWKATIHEPGVMQLEDHRGTNVTVPITY